MDFELAGLWPAESYVSLSLMLHERTVDVSAACSCWWTTSKSAKLTTLSSKLHNYSQGSCALQKNGCRLTSRPSVSPKPTVQNDVTVLNKGVAAQPVRWHRRWAVEVASRLICRQPSHQRHQGIIPLHSASLSCACCYANGDCFFFNVHPPSVLTPFGYSALVPAVSHT